MPHTARRYSAQRYSSGLSVATARRRRRATSLLPTDADGAPSGARRSPSPRATGRDGARQATHPRTPRAETSDAVNSAQSPPTVRIYRALMVLLLPSGFNDAFAEATDASNNSRTPGNDPVGGKHVRR